MLNDYRQLYEDYANTYLTGWKTANKNDLCEHYVTEKEKNSKLADAYLSAIIVRYWSLIESWYNSQMYKFATE